MKYLFGDGVESSLAINYLQYLRLVLEFSAAVLRSQSNVESQHKAAKRKKLFAKQELNHLDELGRAVDESLVTAGAQIPTPIASECAGSLRDISTGEIERAKENVRARLSKALEEIQDTVDRENAENERHLEKLLLYYDIPKTKRRVDLRALDENGYEIQLTIKSEAALDAVLLLGAPENHPFSRPLRMGVVDPDLTINMPHSAVWGRNVKIRAQKLSKEYVVSVTHDADGIHLTLRNAFLDGHSGFDLVFRGKQVSVTRISKQQAAEPFDAEPEEAARLVAAMRRIRGSMNELIRYRRVLKSVQYEGVPLRQHTEPVKLVHHLLAQMGPVTRKIAAHSLAPGELTLKRVLSDDRREEIFVSVLELQEIYADLTPAQKELFAPLGFDQIAVSESVSPARRTGSVPPPRASSSVPPPRASVPPPRASVPPPRASTSVPPPRASSSVPPPASVIPPFSAERPSQPPLSGQPTLPRPSVPPPEPKPASSVESPPEPKSGTEPEAEVKPEAENEPEAEAEPETETEPGAEAKPETETEPEAGAKPESESESEPEPEPDKKPKPKKKSATKKKSDKGRPKSKKEEE